MMKHIVFAALVVLCLAPPAFAGQQTPPASVQCPAGQILNKEGLCEVYGMRDRGPAATPPAAAAPAACGAGQTAGLMGFCATETLANGTCKAPLKKASDGKCYTKHEAALIKNG